MQFADFSPPSSPSLDQQRNALQKGLGRAVQWALAGRLDDEPLLEACLRDQRYDAQVEDTRGDWLWRIIQAIGAGDRFRAPILHGLHELTDDATGAQLCQIAGNYASAGEESFRIRLYEIVEQKPIPDSEWLGEEEIIRLDGEQAFVFCARVRGGRLETREWGWDDALLVENAAERSGRDRVVSLLEASGNEAATRFLAVWRQQHQTEAMPGPQAHAHSFRGISAGEIISAAESGQGRYGLFRGWGMHADEADLRTVLERIWSAQDPQAIAGLLRGFSNRELPEFDSRLIELCEHGDEDVRRRAFTALGKNAHPLIREFALQALRRRGREHLVVGLFINNYEPGDEQRILEAIELPDDACELHWLLMDLIKLLEQNPRADCSRLGVVSYASTPCENCRFYAVRLLCAQQVAPAWLIEECRYDSAEECREVAQTAGPK